MGRIEKYLDSVGKEKFKEAITNSSRLPAFKVKFKLTKRCNLKCKKCNYWRTSEGDNISTDKAKEVIDQIAEGGCHFIKFSGGEITLRKDLPELVSYAKKYGIETSITSNGNLIIQDRVDELISAGIDQINISLDSVDEIIHDELVGVPGAWGKSTSAFKLLNNSKEKYGKSTRLVMQVVICKENVNQIQGLVKLAENIGANSVSLLGFVPFHIEDKSLDLSDEEKRHYVEEILPELKEFCAKKEIALVNTAYTNEVDMDGYFKENPCYIPLMNYYISPSGGVYVCCFSRNDKHIMGNIFENDLKTILDGASFADFRENSVPVCRNKVCHRCIGEIRTNLKIENWLNNGY